MSRKHLEARITETENDLNLCIPKFNCDNALGKIPPPLPANHHVLALVAPPGSGKTSLLLGLITTKGEHKVYRGIFHNLILFMPSSSRDSLANNPFKHHDPRKTFETLNYENLLGVYNMLLDSSANGQNSLLILDDVTSDLKNTEVQKLLSRIINNRRHLRCSIHLLIQGYIAAPLSIRKLITHLALWKPNNLKEIQALAEELLFVSKNTIDAILKHTYQSPHDFLFVNIATQKYHRNFNELHFESK